MDFKIPFIRMKLKKFALLFFLFAAGNLYAQSDSLTLETCRKITIERYPLNLDLNNNIEANSLRIQNIKIVYYPTLNLTGQYIHYSDVPYPPIDNPFFTMEMVPKDQYKALIEARQVIYDGGLTNRRKAVEELNLLTENQDIEVKLYALNNQVNDVYFLILLFQEQQNLLKLTLLNLQEQLKVVESGVRNGVLMPGDADIVKAEILKLNQRMVELDAGQNSGMEILSQLMDSVLTPGLKLAIPEVEYVKTDINRPEYVLMDYQTDRINKLDKLNSSYRYPYLGLFGTFGYGLPGFNVLNPDPDIMYTYGVSLSWNIYDWGKVKRESQINKVMQDKIQTQRQVFDKNLNMSITRETSNLTKLDETMKSDVEIIALRERITSAKASQLKNGVITSSDYIVELNAETQAKINLQLHKIQRLQTIINLQTLQGNLVNNQ
ncbi:MAG: TolC family protein [Bacteroidales bacterium]